MAVLVREIIKPEIKRMKSAIAFMFNTEIFENKKIVWLYQFASAVLTGVCGTIIVSIFLAVILPLDKAVKFIPLLICFNTAMTGYSLADKMRASLKHKHLTVIGAGISNVLITAAVLTGISVYAIGINLLNPVDVAIFLVTGAVCSEFGAWLGDKYHKLNKKTN